MPQEDIEPRLRSSVAGYYSHTTGARYVNPFSSGARFPMLVELHESQHEYLAHGNWTDALARLYTGVLVWGDDALRPEHRQSINELLQAINENIVYTHELVATYLSLLLFSSRHPEDVSAARAELDDFYQEVLRTAETAFGEINDPRLDASIITATLACAVAALNSPFPTEIVRFHRLSECRQFVEQNSPDRRMRLFLKGLRPAWQQESLIGDLHGLNSADIQTRVWSNLRARFPDVEFVTDRPTIMREWVAILKEDALKYSYGFLEGKELLPNAEDTPAEKLGAQFELPKVKDEESLDLSLSTTNYVFGSLAELTTLARACADQMLILHCHVIVIATKNRAELKCFVLNNAGRHAALPIGMEVAFDELLGTLANLPRGSLLIKIDEFWGLKIDERRGLSVAAVLSATNHPVLVLVNNSHPRNLRRLVQDASREQKVSLCPMLEEGTAYGILLVYFGRDRYVVASPTSELGLEVMFLEFANNDSVLFAVTEEVIPNAMGLSMTAIASVLKNCFFVGPPRFDFKKIDYADLLRGVYDRPAASRGWWQFWKKA